MAAYYNEIEPYCVEWLRGLIVAGHIAPGDVDQRDIRDVKSDDLKGYTQCHFFAGISGWSYALRLAEWPDDRPVWTGSCPCQPFSNAGKRKGFDDERHLWPIWFELIRQRRPPVVFGEQVASAAAWLRLVRGDLEAVEYAVGAMPFEAASAGADHLRDRYGFVGVAQGDAGRAGSSPPEQQAVFAEGRRQERRAASEPSGAFHMADTERAAAQRQRGAGKLPGAPSDAAGEGDQRQRSGRSVADRGEGVCDVGNGHVARWPPRGQAPAAARHGSASVADGGDCGWVIGADGKARRVKPGVRLLAHGVSGRVAVSRAVRQTGAEVQETHWYNRIAALKAFGNAIDPRPFAQFVGAYLDSIDGRSAGLNVDYCE